MVASSEFPCQAQVAAGKRGSGTIGHQCRLWQPVVSDWIVTKLPLAGAARRRAGFPRPFSLHPQVQAVVPQQHPVSQHPLVQPQLVSAMVSSRKAGTVPHFQL